jgi:hypothetical protein
VLDAKIGDSETDVDIKGVDGDKGGYRIEGDKFGETLAAMEWVR